VLVLGPYRPPGTISILEELRSCLRRNGYELSEIVRDASYRAKRSDESPETYFLEKSKGLISNWAQILLFIFPADCDYSGVIIEFDHMLYKAGWLRETSSVFFEKRSFKHTSLMLRGQVRSNGINQSFFKTNKDLCEAALSELASHLRTLY